MKFAMLATDRALATSGLASQVVLQVHDGLVLEIAPGEREAVTALACGAMTSVYPLRVPLTVSVGVGPTRRAAEH